MARLIALLMVFAFLLFINIVAALFSSAGSVSNPLLPTIILFQLLADAAFVVGILLLVVSTLRKFVRRATVNRVTSPPLHRTAYQHDGTPFTASTSGWRIVGEHLSQAEAVPPIHDSRERISG